MEGFALPPFESTEIFKEKEIIFVKKKGGSTLDGCNLLDDALEPGDDSLLLLENDNFDKGTEKYQSESEEVDEEQSQDEELPEETISKKRKAFTNLQNLKKKKQCLAVFGDDEDEAKTEETENITNNASYSMKINITKATNKIAAASNKKAKSLSAMKRSEELHENVEEANQVSNASGALKVPSRNARRKKDKRRCMQELAKIGKKKPQQAYSKPEKSKPKDKEAADQPKGLASKKPVQNGGVSTDVGPVVTRSKHIQFVSHDEDHAAKQTGTSTEGDVIAYRLLELNSSWIPECSSFRVGRISYYDAEDIVLVPVTEYPFVLEKNNEDKPNDSLYGTDGTLEINYSALVDVRIVKQYDPEGTEPLSDGVNQTPMSDGKDAAENLVSIGEVNPWNRSSYKNTEMPKSNNPSTVGSGLNRCSYGGAGPSTSTAPDANKAESSKERQNGNSINPWLNANKPDPSQENNSGWSNVLAPTSNNCEIGSSWGRPWSAFVVAKSSSVIQPNKENEWHPGSSRGGWKATSRGAPRGRGRGCGGSHGRGRGQNGN